MEKRSSIFFMKARTKSSSIEAGDIIAENERKMKAIQVKTPKVGPRGKFIHYIKDLNLDLEKATNEILKEFPSLDNEIVENWYKESIKKERTEANNER